MEYVAVGSTYKNVINFSDGTKKSNILGGGGLFAFCGLLHYTDKVTFVTCVGKDIDDILDGWDKRNNVSREGFIEYDNLTTVATMFYEPDGQWKETFTYGLEDLPNEKANFDAKVINKLEEIVSKGRTKGIYRMNSLANIIFLEKLNILREKYRFKVMLELHTKDCNAENLEIIKEKMLPLVDIYSLNNNESFTLFSVKTEDEAIKEILKIGKPCFYRAGKKGSYVIMNNDVVFAPSAHKIVGDQEIDPTGCGNNSTGAALWAFCEGYNMREIANIANVSAAYNVKQYGPYHTFNEETRSVSLKEAVELASSQV